MSLYTQPSGSVKGWCELSPLSLLVSLSLSSWGREGWEEEALILRDVGLKRRLALETREGEEGEEEEGSSVGRGREIRERDEPGVRTRRRHSGSTHFQVAVRLMVDFGSGAGR